MVNSTEGTYYNVNGKDLLELQSIIDDALSNLMWESEASLITLASDITSCFNNLKKAYRLSLSMMYTENMVKEKMKYLED